MRIALGLWLLVLLGAGCFRPSERPGAAAISIGSSASPTAAGARPADPRAVAIEGATSLVEYELRQQMDLTPDSIGQYYQRFVNAAGVLRGYGWTGGVARTFVRRTGSEVPPTVTIQVDRFATGEGAAGFVESLRRNGSPSLSHFLDLAGPPVRVDQPAIGDEAVAFEAGLSDRGITPQVVRVRYYAFRRGAWIGQVIVVRDAGLPWPDILGLARAQDERLAAS